MTGHTCSQAPKRVGPGLPLIAINRFVPDDGSQNCRQGIQAPPINAAPPVYVVDPANSAGGVNAEHTFAHEVGHALDSLTPRIATNSRAAAPFKTS